MQKNTTRMPIPEMRLPPQSFGKPRRPMRFCLIRIRERRMTPMAMRHLMPIPLQEQVPASEVLTLAEWICRISFRSFSAADSPVEVSQEEELMGVVPICRKRATIFA